MSRLTYYCNITSDLQNAYKEIEKYAYEKIDNSVFSAVSGETYSQKGQSGYVGVFYINRISQTKASSLSNISSSTPWYYADNVLYVLTALIGANKLSISSDTWDNIKESAREDASQELESYLNMYNRPLPFTKNSDQLYDRDIVRACAYLTCKIIIEISNPQDPLAKALENMVVEADESGNIIGGIIGMYLIGRKKFSFEATTKTYNGNITPISISGTGTVEVGGHSDDWDSYIYEIEITIGGAVGTAKYKLTKNDVEINTYTTYTNYAHLHADVYAKFIGTFTVGDKWKIEFDGRTKKNKETGLGTIRIVHKDYS